MYQVGDRLVYGVHGVCQVAREEQRRVDELLRLTRNTDDCRDVHFDFNHEHIVVEEKKKEDKFQIKMYF